MGEPRSFPSLLRPTSTEQLLVGGQVLDVPKVELSLRSWTGPALIHTHGGKPLLDFGGRPVFAELCVFELARLSGWDARWVSTFGAPALRPNCLTGWVDAKPSAHQHVPIVDADVSNLLERMAAANGNTYAGCWDVVVWHGDRVIFMELKRRRKDRVQETQLA